MNEQNLELIEQERKRLLEDDLSKCAYGSEDSKAYLQDLKELSAMANEAKELEIEEMKVKAEAEAKEKALQLEYEKSMRESDDKAKERKTNRIMAWIDAGAKVIVAGTAVVVCVLNNKFTGGALNEVLKYESGGEYISSMIGKSVIGGLFRKGK